MAYGNIELRLIGKFLQLCFPKPVSASIASATVCRDKKPVCGRVFFMTHFIPPGTNGVYCKLCGIGTDTNVHIPLICTDIIHAVRSRFPESGQGKIMAQYFYRLFSRGIFCTCVLEIPYVFFLFTVNRNHRASIAQILSRCVIDMPKLRVPVRMLITDLIHLLVDLEAIAHLLQKISYFPVLDVEAFFLESRIPG